MKIKIKVSKDRIAFIHNDEIARAFRDKGKMKVRRLSHVEFDEPTQEWVVKDAKTNHILHRHKSRTESLKWEVAYWQNKLQELS